MSRWHSANVLKVAPEGRRLWQFSAQNGAFSPVREQSVAHGAALPQQAVRKGWSSLWQPKLNIAWVPPEKVYLRVLQLPAADLTETLSMVDLQLEKISPLPVGQIVWSIERLPHSEGDLQTVVVMIVTRNLVENFLGDLEGQGYLPDRLELPLLDQLLATEIREDGVWLYLNEGETASCLVAWRYGGRLQNVTLMPLHANLEGAQQLRAHLSQIAWAGELEGWLTAAPQWHLVASPSVLAAWQPLINEAFAEPVAVTPAVSPADLAARTAGRAAQPDSRSSLLPQEFSTRYQQKFVDQLWMGGIGALFVLYLAGLVVYFSAVYVLKLQHKEVAAQVQAISQDYTNTMQLKERISILEGQSNLKYAAMDCLKTASDLLPEEIRLTSFTFNKGRDVSLYGEVAQDDVNVLLDYNEAMSKTLINGRPLTVSAPQLPTARPNAAGVLTIRWSFTCQIQTGGSR